MSLGWVIAGSIVQLQMCVVLFMMVVLSASGMGDRRGPGRMHTVILKGCMIALPATALLSAVVVICLYFRDAGATGYWWYALPPGAAVLYLGYAVGLAKRENPRAAHSWILRRR